MNEPNIYTVWCQESTGEGTIWISHVEAEAGTSLREIRRKAVKQCREEWGYDEIEETDDQDEGDSGDEQTGSVHCLGIARGKVDLLFWEDTNGMGGGPMNFESMDVAP